MPGVREGGQLFEISRKADVDDDSDLDLYESSSPIQVASAAGLARLAPNGLLKQRESVDVSCLKPALVKMIRQIERRFGNRAVARPDDDAGGFTSACRNQWKGDLRDHRAGPFSG